MSLGFPNQGLMIVSFSFYSFKLRRRSKIQRSLAKAPSVLHLTTPLNFKLKPEY